MKNEHGFSLVELLIVVAIIAIIAAIAVPSLLTSRQAANEASSIQGLRTVGSAEIAFAATNNQQYTTFQTLVDGSYLDARFINPNGFNGYSYAEDAAVLVTPVPANTIPNTAPTGFGILATPLTGMARFSYGILPDQVVRYQANITGGPPPLGLLPGEAIGKSQ